MSEKMLKDDGRLRATIAKVKDGHATGDDAETLLIAIKQLVKENESLKNPIPKNDFPLASKCHTCIQTRDYCYEHGIDFPVCYQPSESSKPDYKEKSKAHADWTEWIMNISEDPEFSLEKLQVHIDKHIREERFENEEKSWFHSTINLVALLMRATNHRIEIFASDIDFADCNKAFQRYADRHSSSASNAPNSREPSPANVNAVPLESRDDYPRGDEKADENDENWNINWDEVTEKINEEVKKYETPAWKKCNKKALTIEYRDSIPGEVITTIEGVQIMMDVNHYVMRGTRGEVYPITKRIFKETYECVE
jgi:hypothetical protein